MTEIQGATFTAGDQDQAADRQNREPKYRFTVDEEYIFLNFFATYAHHGTGKGHWRVVHNPDADELKEIRSLKLRCKSHHKVHISYYENDGRMADGFIFVDESNGREYYNQYPKASYGQLDDSQDRMVMDARIYTDKSDVYTNMSPEEQDFLMSHWILATSSFDSIERAIKEIKCNPTNYSEGALPSLEAFKKQLTEYISAVHKLAVKYEPLAFGRGTDKEVVIKDVFVSSLVPETK